MAALLWRSVSGGIGDFMTDISERSREALVRECKRLQENSLYTATTHFRLTDQFRALHYFLGTLPIIFGAISGWKGLSDPHVIGVQSPVWVPVFSFLAGISGSLLAFWNWAERRMMHFAAGAAYKTLENDARRAWEIYSIDEELAVLKKRVADLGDRYNKLNESSPQTSNTAFAFARKKVKSGIFTTDMEKKEKRDKSTKPEGSFP
ncbi:MAG: SLATT domain-containing protein [Myxococcaceae bacterium]|nr:MAG: SLATT domain-containing protein [Myxococcaceae bacterium]